MKIQEQIKSNNFLIKCEIKTNVINRNLLINTQSIICSKHEIQIVDITK